MMRRATGIFSWLSIGLIQGQLFPKIAFLSMESQRGRILAQARPAQKRKKCIFVL
jgi:hypothetical protein